MIIDPDGPTQESVAFFNQNGFIIPEEKFITEEVFLSDDFTAYIKTIIEEVFEKMNKKFCILQAEYLENNGIGTRQLFAGNILRQPMFVENDILIRINDSDLLHSNNLTEDNYKMLPNTDFIMNHTFWVGTFPALGEKEIDKISKVIHDFIKEHK